MCIRDSWRKREVLAALATLAMRVVLLSSCVWLLLLLFRRRKAASVPKPATATTPVKPAAAEATKAPPEG